MGANKIYVKPGAAAIFAASSVTGQTVLWTPQNVSAGNGRTSNMWDRGAGAHPLRYCWRMRTRWAATANAGDQLFIFLIYSDNPTDATQTDCGYAFVDQTYTSLAGIVYSTLGIGFLMSSGLNQPESASGFCDIYARYVAVSAWNGAGSKALTNTAGDHIFTLTEMPYEIEQAP